MRFTVRHLLITMAVSSVYLALMFALPGVLSACLLTLLSFLAPAIYMGGVIYSRRAWRAFWIGTMTCGMVPAIVSAYYGIAMVFEDWRGLFDGDRAFCYILAACQLLPFLGGVAVVTMRRFYKPTRSIMPVCCLSD